MTRILGGSQNRQKCPKKRHLVLYKLAGFYPDGLTRRSVFKRVGGRGNPQKWPIFGPFLGVNCAKPELIPGGAPRLLTRSPTHNGGRLARWSNRDQSAQRLLFITFLYFYHQYYFCFYSHDVRHRTQSLDALSSEIAWAYPRKSRTSRRLQVKTQLVAVHSVSWRTNSASSNLVSDLKILATKG